MSVTLKNIKPYTLIELTDSKEETHIIVSGEHFEFSEVRFYKDEDEAMNRSERLERKGVKTILLNTHALTQHMLSHEIECLSNELGVTLNYDIKQ